MDLTQSEARSWRQQRTSQLKLRGLAATANKLCA